ncbi:hypothetical protein ACH4PW_31810 [Streptomyces sp. NPDC017082]|uniref:hypothetical protein n=1 Tax=Streptomyces sp. NPDC017082 TaxID=3364974 RepID=UPI0037AB8CD3
MSLRSVRLAPHLGIRFPALTLALALLTSCSTEQESPPPLQPPVSGAEIARIRGSDADQKLLFDARETAIARCMSARGWPYQPTPWRPRRDNPAQDPRSGDDIALHRTAGYGFSTGAQEPPASPNDSYANSLTAERRELYSQALFGTPQHRLDATLPNGEVTFIYTDGCSAQAEKQLYGDLKTWLIADTVVINLRIEVDNRVTADRRLTAATQSWSSCMAHRGYHYDTPGAARTHIGQAYEHAAPSAKGEERRTELAQALADAECDKQVGRARLFRSLDEEYRDQVARERNSQITSYRELISRALIVARPTGSHP